MRASNLKWWAVFVLGGIVVAGVTVAQAPKPAGPAPAPAKDAPGAVAGRVTVPEGQRLPEMVVFLESTDPSYKFTPSEEPVPVSQQGAKFGPGMLVVPVGTRVNFRNDEKSPVEHNVFSNSEAKKFDLGLYGPGQTIEPVRFSVPGAVRLRCSIHRYMDGVVYVTPSPFFAVVGKDGQFSIPGVEPGAYRLKTWQRSQRFPDHDRKIAVTPGKPLDVTLEMNRK